VLKGYYSAALEEGGGKRFSKENYHCERVLGKWRGQEGGQNCPQKASVSLPGGRKRVFFLLKSPSFSSPLRKKGSSIFEGGINRLLNNKQGGRN